MKLAVKNGITSLILRVKILDTSVTTGAGKTGLTHSSSGLIISTIADNEATATAYTQAASNVETITILGTFAAPTASKCRFKEVDSTNHPGVYEIHIANARWAVSSARSVIVSVSGVSGAAQVDAEIQLDPVPANVEKFGDSAGTFASGRPEVNVTHAAGTAWGSGAITATSIAASAFTAAKFDTACFTSAKFDTGAITSTVVADGFITSAKFAAGAIDNAAIATDAIGSAELAASAINEIVDQVWDESNSAHGIPGSTGEAVGVAFYNTENRLPAVLVSGRMDVSVGAMEANVFTASALAADAVNEIVDQVWDEAIAGHAGAGSTGLALSGATAPSAATVADAVWDEALAGHVAAGSTGEALNAAGGAGDPWITTVPGAYGVGSAGYILGTNLNATVSSRASQTSLDTVDDLLDTEIAAIKAKTDNLPTDPADESSIQATLTTIASYIDTEIAAIKAKTDNLPAAPAAVGDIPTVSQIWTTALAEAYKTAGATGTAAQLLYEILHNITRFTNTGVTRAIKKLDGTTAKTYTYDDATTPTALTETT